MGRRRKQVDDPPVRISDEESEHRAREFRQRIRRQFASSLGDVTKGNDDDTIRPDADPANADWPKHEGNDDDIQQDQREQDAAGGELHH